MTRFLAFLLLAVLIGLAARSLVLRARRSPLGQLVETIWRAGSATGASDGPLERPRPAPRPAGSLARCADCGVHVPVERTAVASGGERLCSRCAEQRGRSRSA